MKYPTSITLSCGCVADLIQDEEFPEFVGISPDKIDRCLIHENVFEFSGGQELRNAVNWLVNPGLAELGLA